MSELALQHEMLIDWRRKETHNGRIVYVAQPLWNHLKVSGNLFFKFKNSLIGKDCEAAQDGAYLVLSEENCFVPDMMVICDKSKIRYDGVYGAPDLVVEVLSHSTKKYDRGFKKKTYEKHGVPEYWLVDIENRTVEVYLLADGVLEIDNTYTKYLDYELAVMAEEEIAKIVTVLSPICIPELNISVDEIFEGLIIK